MNYKELLKETSSGWTEKGLNWYVDTYCPHQLFKDAPVDACPQDADEGICNKCWERDVPEEVVKSVWEEITKPANVQIRSTEPNEIVDVVKQMNEMDPETVKRIAESFYNSNEYIVSAKELKAILNRADDKPHILDSGDRTQFETGAVRDMREGKGRCDLMPLEVVAKLMCTHNDTTKPDLVTGSIALFKNSGYQNTIHLYNALLYFSERYYSNHADMFLEVAKHFEEGAKKYGESNWQKGIPAHCYIDSAVRHYLKCVRGDNDEPHSRALVWNLMCCIWEVDYGEEWRKQKGYFNKE